MKDIIKSVSKLSIPTFLNLLSSVIKNKIIALSIGPAGLGVYSQFLNILGLFGTVLPVGSMGLIRYVSSLHNDNRQSEMLYLMRYFLVRNIVLSLLVSSVLVLFSTEISNLLFSTSEYSELIRIFSTVIIITLFVNMLDIYLKSIRQINKYVLFLTFNSIISIAVTVPLILSYQIYGAVLAIVLSALLCLLTGILILKKYKLISLPLIYERVERDVIKNVLGLGLAVLASMVIQNITMLAIKSIIAGNFSLNAVGIFQCVFSISSSYFGVFFVVIGAYSIPKISAMKEDIEIVAEMNSTFRFLLMIYMPVLVVIFALRSLIIPLLYSNDFILAKDLLIYQLPAEFIRAFSWAAGVWLIPKLNFAKWLLFEIIFYSLFLGLFVLMVNFTKVGIYAASMSYLSSYIVFLIINFVYSYKIIKFKFETKVKRQVVLTLIFLTISISVSFYSEFYGYFAAIVSILFWSLFSFTIEDFRQLFILIRRKSL